VVDRKEHARLGEEFFWQGAAPAGFDQPAPAQGLVIGGGSGPAAGQRSQAAQGPGGAEQRHLARVDGWRQLARWGWSFFFTGGLVEGWFHRYRADAHRQPMGQVTGAGDRVGVALQGFDQRGFVRGMHL
jgi:hypothetical protein